MASNIENMLCCCQAWQAMVCCPVELLLSAAATLVDEEHGLLLTCRGNTNGMVGVPN